MLQIILFAGLGLFAMISEVLSIKKILPLITIGVLITNIALSVFFWDTSIFFSQDLSTMFVEDVFTKSFILLSSTIYLIWAIVFRNSFFDISTVVEKVILYSFAMVGGCMMLGFTHLVMLFLGIEILSIPIYILAGSNRKSLKSNEASYKYFLMGAFASCFLLLGITFVYGATGSFDLQEIASIYQTNSANLPSYYFVGILFVLFAMLFKISAVPFHFWTPDVYQGAPTPVTAFMSTVVKIFATATTFKLFDVLLNDVFHSYSTYLLVLVALTMLLGNILGAVQNNPKRILAYSSVGHTGFMLLAIYIGDDIGLKSLFYYGIAYSLSSILAFYVLSVLFDDGDQEFVVKDLYGLSERNTWLGFALTIPVLSMAGLPPLSGFFAKYFVFNAAYTNGDIAIVLVAIIASLIAVYYYLSFVIAIYGKKKAEGALDIQISFVDKGVIIALVILIMLVGVLPDFMTSYIH